MRLKLLSFISLFVGCSLASESRSCLWSKKTAVCVPSCPQSKEEMEARAKNKDCVSIAHSQNCTKPEHFKYHCLINEFENASIEVCAESYYIVSGYCAEYNTLGALIQQHTGLKCSVGDPPCPLRYLSTDSYQYKVCYDAVSKKRHTSSMEMTTVLYNMSLSSVPPNDIDDEILAMVVIMVIVGAVVIGLIIAFMRYKKIGIFSRGCGDSAEEVEENVPLTSKLRKLEHKGHRIENICEEENFEDALENADRLRNLLSSEDTNEETLMREVQERTEAFLKAYEHVIKTFVETKFTKKCLEILQTNKLAIIIGQQGCGKTLTAIHILNNDYYRDWKKHKIICYEDLLAIKVHEETELLVYIDNILDGFIHRENVRHWWYSLCYFFFRYVKKSKHIHLLITAKEDVVGEALEHINADTFSIDNACFVREGEFCLSDEEKIEILESQFKFAKELKNYDNSCAKTLFDDEIKVTERPSIGFPLCAHLYAFDNTMGKRTSVFEYPKDYVLRHIDSEIAKDDTNGVRTLFLVLLFYHTQSGSKFTHRLDLRYEEDCRQYLVKTVSEAFVESMEPLLFKNLYDTAMGLKDVILVKHANMFEFKHQIYLEGVSDYFFRHPKYSEVAVKNFPLDILRPYEFQGALENILRDIIQRFKKEIFKGMQAVLSCKIFGKSEFESKFCEELNKDKILQRLLFNPNEILEKELPFTFWTSKYHLKILSESALAAVRGMNQRSDYLFYQARLGECCKTDKKYFANSTNSTTGLGNAEQLVWNFKTPTGGSILHVILSSDMPDYEANTILLKLLNDAAKQNNLMDTDLLKCAMEQMLYSRIACMLSILQNEKVESEKISISCIVKKISSCKKYNARLELEFLVRICILLAHGLMRKTCAKLPSVNQEFRLVEELLHEKHSQQKMSAIIQRCISKCKITETETTDSIDIKCTTCKRKFSPEFEKAIKDAVQVQTRKGNLLTS